MVFPVALHSILQIILPAQPREPPPPHLQALSVFSSPNLQPFPQPFEIENPPEGLITSDTQTIRSAEPVSIMERVRCTLGIASHNTGPVIDGDSLMTVDSSGDDGLVSSSGAYIERLPDFYEVFRFMDLPEELRCLMYSFFLAIPPGEEFQLDQSLVDWSFHQVSAAILMASKQIYREAFPVFLRTNRFLVGSSLTSPNVFRDFGPQRSVFLRSISIHLNDRAVNDCIQILDGVVQCCDDIRYLELRVSPGSLVLPHLTSILCARARLGSLSKTCVTLRLSIRKSEAVVGAEQDAMITTADQIQKSERYPFRWPQILERAHEVIIKGCIYRTSLDALEGFEQKGWYLEKTSTTKVTDCMFREGIVTRTWKEGVPFEDELEIRSRA